MSHTSQLPNDNICPTDSKCIAGSCCLESNHIYKEIWKGNGTVPEYSHAKCCDSQASRLCMSVLISSEIYYRFQCRQVCDEEETDVTDGMSVTD